MAIAKLLLLFVGAVAEQYVSTPPNVQPPTGQLREQHGSERMLPLVTTLGKTLLFSRALLEGSVLFALSGYCPPTLARPLLHFLLPTTRTSDPTTLTALTPAFLAGTLLTLAGALLRAHCFRALGSRFTFELSIRPAHALVTDGVYGVVRHPSYTGALGVAVGWLLCVLDRRGYVVAVFAGLVPGGDATRGHAVVVGVLACAWATMLGVLYVGLSKRMDKEDAMLEKHFGEAWRTWAKKVPWRLVPGVC